MTGLAWNTNANEWPKTQKLPLEQRGAREEIKKHNETLSFLNLRKIDNGWNIREFILISVHLLHQCRETDT